MIKSVTVVNHLGESLKLDLASPEKSGFIVKSIEGLGPVKATVNTTKMSTTDGALYNSARVDERNIVLRLEYMQKETIEEVRHLSYKYFPVKKQITFIVETEKRKCAINGYVESNEPEIFNKQSGCQISIICPYPYFHDANGKQETIFSGIAPSFEFKFPTYASLESGTVEIAKIKGNTMKWTQLAPNYVSSSSERRAIIYGPHKYYTRVNGKESFMMPSTSGYTIELGDDTTDMIVDLTELYGQGKEPEPGRQSWTAFKNMFPLSNYEYNAGTLIHFCGNGIKSYDKKGNEIGSISLPISEYFPTGMKSTAVGTKETWVIEGKAGGVFATTQISFTSNGQKFTSIGAKYVDFFVFLYYDNNEIAGYDPGAGNGLEFYNEAYRTLTFDTPPTGALFPWLQANGVKQPDNTAGLVYDELTKDEAIQRCDVVDGAIVALDVPIVTKINPPLNLTFNYDSDTNAYLRLVRSDTGPTCAAFNGQIKRGLKLIEKTLLDNLETGTPWCKLESQYDLIEFGRINNMDRRTIYYSGESDAGISIELHALGSVINPSIFNANTREYISIDTTKLELSTGNGIIAGDTIYINTAKGQKSVLLDRGGNYYNILNCIGAKSSWMQLSKGDNVFVYTSEYGTANLQLKISNYVLYEGV